MDYASLTRAQAAETISHVVRTPSIEDSCRAAARARTSGRKCIGGQDIAEDAIRAQQLKAMGALLTWQAANPGTPPDLEALLPE